MRHAHIGRQHWPRRRHTGGDPLQPEGTSRHATTPNAKARATLAAWSLVGRRCRCRPQVQRNRRREGPSPPSRFHSSCRTAMSSARAASRRTLPSRAAGSRGRCCAWMGGCCTTRIPRPEPPGPAWVGGGTGLVTPQVVRSRVEGSSGGAAEGEAISHRSPCSNCVRLMLRLVVSVVSRLSPNDPASRFVSHGALCRRLREQG